MSSGELIQEKERIIARQEAQIVQLRQALDWIKKQLFGQKRERFEGAPPEQLALDLGGSTPAPEVAPAQVQQIRYTRKKKTQHPGRHPLPAHLERVEMIIELQENTGGYAVYDQFEQHPDITLLGCMAHARRYFVKAKSNDPQRVNFFLTQLADYPINRIEELLPHRFSFEPKTEIAE